MNICIVASINCKNDDDDYDNNNNDSELNKYMRKYAFYILHFDLKEA